MSILDKFRRNKSEEQDDPDAALLTEIRERFEYAQNAWAWDFELRKVDMCAVAGDPWPDDARALREAFGRPVICEDEINQYVHQAVNEVRQSKRAINLTPKGNGANDDTARFKADLIRSIEYESGSLQIDGNVYQDCLQQSMGWTRLVKEWVPGSSDQRIRYKRIADSMCVLPSPDFVAPDGEDIEWLFVFTPIPWYEFKRNHPESKITDFQALKTDFSQWVLEDDQIIKAEYWYKEKKKRKILLLDDGSDNGVDVYVDECAKVTANTATMADGAEFSIIDQHEEDSSEVYCCITNGMEILKRTKWDAPSLPFAPCIGEQIFVNRGGGRRREIRGMVRLMVGPQIRLNYARSAEVETMGSTSRAPVDIYDGQIEGTVMEKEWANSAVKPMTYRRVKAYTKEYTQGDGKPPLPLPRPNNWEPPIQAYEIAAQSAIQAIRAASGNAPLPVSARGRDEKSGVALEKIDAAESQGSYHFQEAYEAYLKRKGVLTLELIPYVYSRKGRTQALRGKDNKSTIVRLNSPDKDGSIQYDVTRGDHDVTVGSGPSEASQRTGADKLVDQLITPEMLMLAIQGQPKASKIVAEGFRLRNGGAIVDNLADIIDPETQEGKQDPAAMAQQMQQQLQQAAQIIKELQKKADDNATKLEIAKLDADTKLKIAGVNYQADAQLQQTKEQGENQRTAAEIQADLAEEQMKQKGEDRRKAMDHQHAEHQAELGHERTQELNVQQHIQQQDLQSKEE